MSAGDRVEAGSPDGPGRVRRIGGRAIAVGGWLCLVGSVGAWVALRAGDVWAPATVAMYAPLPLLVVPPALLLAGALLFRRRALWTLTPALLLTLGPVSGFCVPWGRLADDPTGGPRLRVMTCNMHYGRVSPDPLDRLIDEAGPDVVVLQEWRDGARSEALAGRDWHTHREPGQFLASRYPIRRADRVGSRSVGDTGSVARYELDTPAGVVTVFSAHLASPREGLGPVAAGETGGLEAVAANSALRWSQSRKLAAAADRSTGAILVLGDLNTPPHSALFRRVWDGYTDAFGSAGWGWGFTFVARASSVRIDHILVGGGGRARRCWVGPDVGSPHRPVLADVAWPAAPAAR